MTLVRLTSVLLFVAALVLLAARASAQTIQVTPLTRDDRVLVTFRLSDVFNEDVRSAIHSGLTITFIYDVELRRGASLWLDRTMASGDRQRRRTLRHPDPALSRDEALGRADGACRGPRTRRGRP